MKSICTGSLLFIMFSVSCIVISPLSVAGEKSPQNTNGIHQGDLVLSGSTNHTIIGETFHINGSIVITENATLYLRDATLNFTQTQGHQFNITLRDPVDGRPRLKALDSIVASGDRNMDVHVLNNGTALLADTDARGIMLRSAHVAVLNISRTVLEMLEPGGLSADSFNSTFSWVNAARGGTVSLRNTTMGWLWVRSYGVNATIAELKSGFIEDWSYPEHCSVTGITYPNLTLHGSSVESWAFDFQGSSNVTLERSAIDTLYLNDQTKLASTDSEISRLELDDEARADLVNSPATVISLSNRGSVWIYWYLDVHVVDSIDQDVPMATVTARFANGTQADAAQTDDSGWARLALLDWMQNTTAQYTQGPYDVTATYQGHVEEDTVEVDWNTELTIALPFVIPELPLAPLLVTATLILAVTVLLLKRRLPSQPACNTTSD